MNRRVRHQELATKTIYRDGNKHFRHPAHTKVDGLIESKTSPGHSTRSTSNWVCEEVQEPGRTCCCCCSAVRGGVGHPSLMRSTLERKWTFGLAVRLQSLQVSADTDHCRRVELWVTTSDHRVTIEHQDQGRHRVPRQIDLQSGLVEILCACRHEVRSLEHYLGSC